MPVIFQKIVKREDLIRNFDPQNPLSNVLYVYGDNVKRVGMGGQAGEMRRQPNAVGIATKYTPDEFFGEEAADIEAQRRVIDRDMKPLFAHAVAGGIIVWPADGIGTKLAGLAIYAPTTLAYIESKLAALIRVAKLFDRGAAHGRILEEARDHL